MEGGAAHAISTIEKLLLPQHALRTASKTKSAQFWKLLVNSPWINVYNTLDDIIKWMIFYYSFILSYTWMWFWFHTGTTLTHNYSTWGFTSQEAIPTRSPLAWPSSEGAIVFRCHLVLSSLGAIINNGEINQPSLCLWLLGAVWSEESKNHSMRGKKQQHFTSNAEAIAAICCDYAVTVTMSNSMNPHTQKGEGGGGQCCILSVRGWIK